MLHTMNSRQGVTQLKPEVNITILFNHVTQIVISARCEACSLSLLKIFHILKLLKTSKE